MKIGEYDNKYGTRTSKHVCEECGEAYEITPAVTKGSLMDFCLDESCESYHPDFDLSVVFMTDKEISEKKKLVSIKMLQKRKKFQNTGDI